MKKFYSHLAKLVLVPALLNSAQAYGEAADWKIDAEHFSISFGVEHIGFQTQLGMFLEASGTFNYDPETQVLNTGRVEVQADSIFSNNEDRDNHLTGRDFLNAKRSPVIVFEATGFNPSTNSGENQSGTLNGNLTMLGETHPVALKVVINKREKYPFGHRKETLGISATATILRSLWGMDYGVGNNLVGDEVSLRFELEALRQ